MKSHTTLLNQLIDALYAAPLSPEIHPYQILAAEIRGQMGTPAEAQPLTAITPVSYVKEANEWVKSVSGEVTISNFKEWLEDRHPSEHINVTSLNNPIRKLVQAGKLEVSYVGSGRRPSVYVRPGRTITPITYRGQAGVVVGDAPTPDNEGWIENTGEEPQSGILGIKRRDGTESHYKRPLRPSAFNFDITPRTPKDITHYKPA